MVKVCIMCKSILLESALKNILKNHVTTFSECDVVLTDQNLKIDRPYLFISTDQNSDIKKPFTHSSLMLQLEKFTKMNRPSSTMLPKELEVRIESLTRDFTHRLTSIISEYYENK